MRGQRGETVGLWLLATRPGTFRVPGTCRRREIKTGYPRAKFSKKLSNKNAINFKTWAPSQFFATSWTPYPYTSLFLIWMDIIIGCKNLNPLTSYPEISYSEIVTLIWFSWEMNDSLIRTFVTFLKIFFSQWRIKQKM